MSIKSAVWVIWLKRMFHMKQEVEDIKPGAESLQSAMAILPGQRGVYDLYIKVPAEMLLVSTNRLKPLRYGNTK